MTFSLFYVGFSSHFTIAYVFYGLLLIQLDSFHTFLQFYFMQLLKLQVKMKFYALY